MSLSATARPPHGSDVVQPFLLERAAVRGRFVRLATTLDWVLGAHDYPDRVGRELAELMVLAGAFVGALKFEGVFSLQVRADGPIRLLVVDVTNDGIMRGYASFDRASLLTAHEQGTATLYGRGVLALTVDQRPAGGAMQQGIVRLDGRSLSEAVLAYFHQSEQIPTGLRTAIGRDPFLHRWRAAGIVVQAMPGEGSQDPEERAEHWRRVMLLLQTASEAELLSESLSIDEVLWRLFHEEGVRVFQPLPIEPGCSCDEERVREMLLRFPRHEIEAMRLEDGAIEVTCQFCSRRYRFARDDVSALQDESDARRLGDRR
ncbi:33 kDa chaperonin [bacterium HR40]|nr:33 kDa chaperonin [bacterium HR40]